MPNISAKFYENGTNDDDDDDDDNRPTIREIITSVLNDPTASWRAITTPCVCIFSSGNNSINNLLS